MSRVRGRNTRPEVLVRRKLWSNGFRYRLHVKALPGTPDLVLSKYRMAVFVHGCFWHQHGCAKSKRPSSNREFWDQKLNTNVERDARHLDELARKGWATVVIWECTLGSDTEDLLKQLGSLRATLASSIVPTGN